jgi:aspartyl/asparaginyl beta-hydroxylase (cupin superfamily)
MAMTEETGQDGVTVDDAPPIWRPGLLAATTIRILSWAEKLNRRYSRVPNVAVFDTGAFPWAQRLEAEWRTIRAELDEVLRRQSELPAFQDILSDVGELTTDEGWKSFMFAGYGVKTRTNIAQCPRTWEAIRRIPGLKSAMFSIFEPGKHLPPHRGPYNGVLRLHLGLVVPPEREQLGIRVDGTLCRWDEGKVMIFDDAYEHEAWNHSPDTRVVLFVDFVRPLRFPANVINWLLLHLAMFTPYIREGADKQRTWEKRFYGRG